MSCGQIPSPRWLGIYFVSSRGILLPGVNGTPISEDYKVPFKFTGKLDKVAINITEEKLTEEQLWRGPSASQT